MTKRKGSLAPTITCLLQQAFALSPLDLGHSALRYRPPAPEAILIMT